jgi:hypothetical protein
MLYSDYVRCEALRGQFLYFPKKYAKLVEKKRDLVEQAMTLKKQGLVYEANAIISKIVRINRRIPACGISEEQHNRAMGV